MSLLQYYNYRPDAHSVHLLKAENSYKLQHPVAPKKQKEVGMVRHGEESLPLRQKPACCAGTSEDSLAVFSDVHPTLAPQSQAHGSGGQVC